MHLNNEYKHTLYLAKSCIYMLFFPVLYKLTFIFIRKKIKTSFSAAQSATLIVETDGNIC